MTTNLEVPTLTGKRTNLEVPTMAAYALNGGWLEQTPVTTTSEVQATLTNGIGTYTSNWWPNSATWYYYPTAERRPIKLGLSEVEKLRSAAKRDAKLKKILEKFTDQIEVVVDFK